MHLTAHQRNFGVNDEDEPFTFLWIHDDDHDFVFSLTRAIDGGDETPIEFMVLDQVWEQLHDFDCRIDGEFIRAHVPVALRKHTAGDDELIVRHLCTDGTLYELVSTLRTIFHGKGGLNVNLD